MTLGEKILEDHKIMEAKILEVDIQVIIETRTLEVVEVGLGKDNIQVILEGVTEPVPTEIELDVLKVGNMIILLRPVQTHKEKKIQNRYNKFII